MTFTKTRISVFGGRDISSEIYDKTYILGGLLAKEGYLVYCGGGQGVMEAIAKGVYKNKYKRIVANDKIHVNKLTLRYRISKPIVINDKPKILAVLIEIFFVGRTLFFVLSISLSDSDSNTLFITEDPVEERRVPRTV